eukprot:6187145-Pleurochrysis_carterae.AAC.1
MHSPDTKKRLTGLQETKQILRVHHTEPVTKMYTRPDATHRVDVMVQSSLARAVCDERTAFDAVLMRVA